MSKSQESVVIEPTAHPRAYKFIFAFDLKREGSVSFSRPEHCAHIPLAAALIAIPGVAEIYFSANVLVLTRTRESDWNSLEGLVRSAIAAHIDEHDPEMPLAPKPGAGESTGAAAKDGAGADEMIVIDNVLTQTIRPYIHSHGGEVELLAFDPQTRELLLNYQGTCGHCSFSTEGTLYLIQDILREEYDPRIKVQVA